MQRDTHLSTVSVSSTPPRVENSLSPDPLSRPGPQVPNSKVSWAKGALGPVPGSVCLGSDLSPEPCLRKCRPRKNCLHALKDCFERMKASKRPTASWDCTLSADGHEHRRVAHSMRQRQSRCPCSPLLREHLCADTALHIRSG